MGRLRRWSAFPSGRVFLGVDNRDPRARLALDPHVLRAIAALREGIAFQSSQAFIRRLPCIGGSQEAHMTGLSDHEEVFARVTLLLAAVVVLLVLGGGRAVDRSLSTIRPNRGDNGTSSVRLAAGITAHSSALRAGSNS